MLDRGDEAVARLAFERLGVLGDYEILWARADPSGKSPHGLGENNIHLEFFFAPEKIDAVTLDISCQLLAEAGLKKGDAFQWGISEVSDEDYQRAFRENFESFPVPGAPVFILPPWETDEPDKWKLNSPPDNPETGYPLVINPALAFGTGLHETSQLCLAEIYQLFTDGGLPTEEILLPEMPRVLDMGCGSGILSLLAAQLGGRVRGYDVSAEAVKNARENWQHTRDFLATGRWPFSAKGPGSGRLTELADPIFATGDFETARAALKAPTDQPDLLLGNLTAGILEANLDHLLAIPFRVAVLSGITTQRGPALWEKIAARGLRKLREVGKNGWSRWTLAPPL